MPVFPSTSSDLHSQMESQVDFYTRLSQHALESLAQLGELNMRAARQLTDDGIRLGRALAACSEPSQLVAVATRESRSAFEHWRDWQTQCTGLLAAGTAPLAQPRADHAA